MVHYKQKIIKNPFLIKLLPFILTLIYFIFVTLYITYPLVFHLSNMISEPADGLYIDWILNWNIHSFLTNISNIFNANIFYPYHNTLAYSDTHTTSALLALFPTKIIGEPAVAFNFIFLFSLITFGFFTYVLSYFFTKNHFASIVSGTLVAFSTYTLTKPMHIQLLNICWVPLSILFFIKFLDGKKYRYLIISIIFLVIQLYNSFLPGYFILFSLFFVTVYYLFKKKIKLKEFSFLKIFLTMILGLIIILPVIIPYYQVSKEFNYERDIRDSIQFANRPEYTLYPGFASRLGPILLNTFYKYDKGPFTYDGFIGGVFFVLSISAIIYRIRNRRKNYLFFDIFMTTGIFGFILSLGPVLQWGGHVIKHPFIIPLPYALFYYLVPGFNGLRNSARWEMLFLFSVSICIGIFLTYVFEKKTNVFKFLVISLFCLLIILEFKFPYNYYQVPTKDNFPKVYKYISNLPQDSVISEFPLYNWGTFPAFNSESRREYYSTLSFYKTFNGTAGFNPPPWQKKATFLIKYFPNDESIKLLKENGVNYIVLHSWEYDLIHNKNYNVDGQVVPSGNEIKKNLENIKNVELIYSIDNDYVYKIK